jgi:ATP-binding cassette subfamily B protein
MPQLLILDEATSAMDRENEQFIMRTLQKIRKDTAIILITHKPQLLKAIADNILVVENGIVAAQGTHKSLLQYDNLYRRYWSDIVD